jgi:hypothetical protein
VLIETTTLAPVRPRQQSGFGCAYTRQVDGEIVVAGYSDASVSIDFALARYLGS